MGLGAGILPLLPPKLVRIMLETRTLIRKYYKYGVLENKFYYVKILKSILNSTKIPLILLTSAIFWKQSVFFGKNGTFTEIYSMKAVLEMF